MERLEKKIDQIYRKCQSYGCNFEFDIVGDEFREITDEHGRRVTAHYIIVEAEGTAVINGWEFAAALEHTPNGNIIKGVPGIEIPERYYKAAPVCEHCNTIRNRKDTYVVRNRETGEFKQVGKSCLKDYTHGLSVELAAQYVSLFDELIRGEAPYQGACVEHFINTEEYLRYVAETTRRFGYTKCEECVQGTADKALGFYQADHGAITFRGLLERLQNEMQSVDFNANAEENVKLVHDALAWLAGQKPTSSYVQSLGTACSLEYVTQRNYKLVASLLRWYNREVTRHYEAYRDESGSEFVGREGDALKVDAQYVKCLTSWEGQYGTTYMYKILGHDGNTYIWKTGKGFPSSYMDTALDTGSLIITGTVKKHAEFNGVKQTELTRCKLSI